MSTADYTLQPAWIIFCYIQYISAFRNGIRMQQWGMGMGITEEEGKLRPRRGSCLPRSNPITHGQICFTSWLRLSGRSLNRLLARYNRRQSHWKQSWARFKRMMRNHLLCIEWYEMVWFDLDGYYSCVAKSFRTCGMTLGLFGSLGSGVSELWSGTCSFFWNFLLSRFLMGKAWVLRRFKNILIGTCRECLRSTDESKRKQIWLFVDCELRGEVHRAIEGTTDTLPEDAEKVGFVRQILITLTGDIGSPSRGFENSTDGYANGNAEGKSKADTRGHASRRRPGMGDRYARNLYADRIAEVRIGLSTDTRRRKRFRIIAALTEIWDSHNK